VREALDDLVADDDFWGEQARTLGVYATADTIQTFRLLGRPVAWRVRRHDLRHRGTYHPAARHRLTKAAFHLRRPPFIGGRH